MTFTKELLLKLCKANSTSGNENEICKVISEYFDDRYILKNDALGNLIVERKGNGKRILLDAHADQIGLVVTYITENGFLKIGSCGGVDTRVFDASDVIIHGKKDIRGVITSVPPHLSKNSNENKASDIDEISIDIGLTKEEAEKIVSLGDRITFYCETAELLDNNITSVALDNRAGVATLILTAMKLDERAIDANLSLLFSSREETGGSGAITGAFSIDADEAIAVDVSFATAPGIDNIKAKKLGEGPMICISPSLDNSVSDKLIEISERNSIPYQLEVCSSRTGTNADHISVSGNGKKTGLVSIPLRNMHTSAEIVSLTDIENTAELLAKYIEEKVENDV